MRTNFLAGAALAATISGVSAMTSEALCASVNGGVNDNENFYCKAVDKILYTGMDQAGTYQSTTAMDGTTGVCSHSPVNYNGGLSPLDGEVSLHFRGPMNVKQVAVYGLGSTSTKSKVRRHAHHRRHGHHHAHRRADAEPAVHTPVEKIENKREVGNMVYATINGVLCSWTNEYGGPTGAAAAPAAAAATGSPASGGYSNNAAPSISLDSGDWGKTGYYNVATKDQAYGVAWLNNRGDGSNSGTWDTHFGSSLSYATCDGKTAAKASTPFDGNLESSDEEIILFTDQTCSGDSCGFYRQNSVAHHGFDGASKAFLFEFQMPLDGKTSNGPYAALADAPAIWMLNANIPRVLQYGSDTTGTPCSCWATGCGEFDIMEVLASGDLRCKSTLHRNGGASGGDSNYFNRPTTNYMKLAVVMHGSDIAIKVLDDSFDFGDKLTSDQINQILTSDDASDTASIFNISKRKL